MEDSKKIVHLCLSCFFVDGYSYQENLLPKYHVKLGYNVSVIASLLSFNKEGRPCYLEHACEYNDPAGFRVIRLEYKHGLLKRIYKVLKIYKNTFDVLKKEKPDIIFIHGTCFSDIKYVKKYAEMFSETIVYADSHADWINSARNFLSREILHKIVWRHYTLLILPCVKKIYGVLPIRCDFLHEMYNVPKNKIELLPMGVDDEAIPNNLSDITNLIRTELGISNNDFVVVTGGKIDKLKNIHLLVKAIDELCLQNLHLIVFGVVLPSVQEELDKLKCQNVHFVGWCNSKQVIDYIISSDLACYPGTHSALWEQTVGLGKPCVFKDWKGMHHVDINGNCIFIKDEDVSSIKKALQFAMENYLDLKEKANKASLNFRYSEIASRAIEM